MKSYNNLYEQMLKEEYIKQCFKDASKKKRNRDDVQEVMQNIDKEVQYLKEMLKEEMFIPDSHNTEIINKNSSKKTRRIVKPHYKYEQVVHHCAIGQFKKIAMKGLYEFSCGSVPGRGVHYGKKYMDKWISSYKGRKMYVLKMDVHHFFESIDREILKRKIKETIRDKRFYRLLCVLIEYDRVAEVTEKLIIDGAEISEEETKELVESIAFGNDSKALNILKQIGEENEEIKEIIKSRKNGVPLGYFTSQWFGNFYLKKLDHHIKEVLKAEKYMRYMDDMVIFGRNKRKLHRIRKEIEAYLKQELHLEFKEDWQVFQFEYEDKRGNIRGRMLDFMGFKFHRDRITIRKSNIEKARRKANRIAKKEKISWYNATVMLSYMGLFKGTDTYGYYLKYIKPKVNVKKLKRIVSKHTKKENERNERLEEAKRNTDGKARRSGQNIVTDNGIFA